MSCKDALKQERHAEAVGDTVQGAVQQTCQAAALQSSTVCGLSRWHALAGLCLQADPIDCFQISFHSLGRHYIRPLKDGRNKTRYEAVSQAILS